jgi:hypothetical protein
MIALLLAASGCCRPLMRRPLFPLLSRCMPCQGEEVYGDVIVPNGQDPSAAGTLQNP